MKITKKHHLVVERKKPLVYFIDKFVFCIFFCCKMRLEIALQKFLLIFSTMQF